MKRSWSFQIGVAPGTPVLRDALARFQTPIAQIDRTIHPTWAGKWAKVRRSGADENERSRATRHPSRAGRGRVLRLQLQVLLHERARGRGRVGRPEAGVLVEH